MNTALNTLYVTADESRLNKEGETVVVTVGGEKRSQLPLIHLKGIVCLGRSWVTPELMAECAERGIHVSFFSFSGRFLARVEGLPGGNVLLRRAQFRIAEDAEKSLHLAKTMVLGKISNGRTFLLHARRDSSQEVQEPLKRVALDLEGCWRSATEATGMDSLRGAEGAAARFYFSALPLLIKGPAKEDFQFDGRNRQPPRDPVNSLLSFGYALLLQDCAGALAGVGLDPGVGYLHEDRPGRLGLALDLMEEFRTPIVDRLVLSLLNRGQIGPGDFRKEGSGAVTLSEQGRKTFLTAYQKSKQEEVQHKHLDIKVPWGRVPHLQALLLARTLRGDLESYPPVSLR